VAADASPVLEVVLTSLVLARTKAFLQDTANHHRKDLFVVGQVSVGPVSVGPVSVGPVSEGPVLEGPVSVGQVSVGPVSVGPVLVGPVSVALGMEAVWELVLELELVDTSRGVCTEQHNLLP